MRSLLLLAVAVPAAAQSPAGFDPSRLARIDSFMQRYVDSGQIAGAVALVMRNGQVVYQRAVGWSDREAKKPMTMNSIFRIASQSKALTSVAIMELVEEGKIALTDPLSRFIPEYAHTTVAIRADSIVNARRPITIRDLLTQTAGISYGTDRSVSALYKEKGFGPAAGMGWYFADKNEKICTSVERLASLPFMAQPGEKWVYGYGTDILGCVVERVSGLPLDEFVRRRITHPLGMVDTYYFLPKDKAARLATVYYTDSTGHAIRAPDGPKGQGDYVDGPRMDFSGGAGMLSTARDYARFCEMLLDGGALNGARLLSPFTVNMMTVNQTGTLYNQPDQGFGLGFYTIEKLGADGTQSSVGSWGWAGAYGSTYRVDPKEKLVMIFMINQLPVRHEVANKFPTLVYQALVHP